MARTKPGALAFEGYSELWPPENVDYINRLLFMSALAEEKTDIMEEAMRLSADCVQLLSDREKRALGSRARHHDIVEVMVSGSPVFLGLSREVNKIAAKHHLQVPWFVMTLHRAIASLACLWVAEEQGTPLTPEMLADVWICAPYEGVGDERALTYPPLHMGRATARYIEECRQAERAAGWVPPDLLVPRDVLVFVRYRVKRQPPDDIVRSEDLNRRQIFNLVGDVEKKLGLPYWRQRAQVQ
jgi:hypothetical protein